MVRGRRVVGAGAGSSRPDVPDWAWGIDRERVLGMFLYDRPVGFHGGAQIAASLRFLGPLEKLLRGTARFIFARRFVAGFFAGLEHDGAPGRSRQGEANRQREKKDAKGVFHRVAQGS